MDRPDSPPIPLAADELTTLTTFLDYYRADLLDRAWGLTHGQLQIAVPPSTLTLSRLIGHLALVENWWFREVFEGSEPAAAYVPLDFDADRDAEMTLAEAWTVEELFARFTEEVEHSREVAGRASSLDQLSVRPSRNGEHWNLRWILVHMIEEYTRHCGHADLIRESIDGDVAR